MKNKLFITLISFFLICATLFTGCQTETNPNPNTNTESQTADAIAEYLTVIDANGNSEFRIVRASNDDKDVFDAAVNLYTRIKNKYKKNLLLVADTGNGETGTVSNDDYEILIGATNRAESQEVLATLDENDYTICVKGNKLVIVGGTDAATVYAVDMFLKKVVSAASADVGLQIKADEPIKGKYKSSVVELYEDADFRIMTFNIAHNTYEPDVRKKHILNLVETYEPTVLCLQECNAANYTRVVDALSTTYGVAFRTHTDGSGIVIYTPILYRKDKLQLVESGGGWLRDRYTGTSTKSISWAVLKLKDSGKMFAVSNHHGAIASNSYAGQEHLTTEELLALQSKQNIGNMCQVLEIYESIRRKYGDIGFLSTADFNFNSDKPAYQFALNNGLVSAETHATVSRVTGVGTTHTPGAAARWGGKSIDHIFYFPETITAYVHYIGTKTVDELAASDHLMVYADVGLLK